MSWVTSPASLAPTGAIVQFSATTAPTGWLLCNASAVSRTTYAALFAVIGTTYGTGDGSTTFNVPDFTGRTAVGSGKGSYTGASTIALGSIPVGAGVAGGEQTHTLSGAESGTWSHSHSITDTTHAHTTTAHYHTYTDFYNEGGGVNVTVGGDYSLFVNGYHGATYRTSGSASQVNASSAVDPSITVSNDAANASSAHNIMQPHSVFNYIIRT